MNPDTAAIQASTVVWPLRRGFLAFSRDILIQSLALSSAEAQHRSGGSTLCSCSSPARRYHAAVPCTSTRRGRKAPVIDHAIDMLAQQLQTACSTRTRDHWQWPGADVVLIHVVGGEGRKGFCRSAPASSLVHGARQRCCRSLIVLGSSTALVTSTSFAGVECSLQLLQTVIEQYEHIPGVRTATG